MSVKIGIIGGSGLSDPDLLKNGAEQEVDTPFGKPSDSLKTGEIAGVPCVLLARHGRSHATMPTNVNFRANIWALKMVGCTHLLVTTACGSLQENIHPGEIVVLDQFIDRTQKRIQTFHDGSENAPPGICHMPMAEPFCPRTSQLLYDCAKELSIGCHKGGTMLTIEGPRFSSKAESKLFHSWGAHCINMTTVPEVVLAKEAGLCYASMALVTDYDSWRDNTESVNVQNVMKTFKLNASNALKVLMKAIPLIGQQDWSETIKANQDMVKSNTMLPHSY
ncbi:S-methyl-5'-thioadenosine phosphorylase-like [Mizuhopecten yessoensis]|uniref:S-methyl-5'-thioadenosine phosphorylase-like n=1 Tax=Mizuhopecten yessoensis TaxID=6573 RepID=UPI000B45DF7F|nr:S-methyl-5'-thioadenosine phosphorylase-like [Mizuhopecten yessoensis]XP_021359798.1 S-methyl-5'-thioadenosine phosphorylase-like [Mizuhopecten yessoensis]